MKVLKYKVVPHVLLKINRNFTDKGEKQTCAIKLLLDGRSGQKFFTQRTADES